MCTKHVNIYIITLAHTHALTQAQAFCPEFNHHEKLSFAVDAATARALCSQHMCIEMWHHPSRSLAAMAAAAAAPTQHAQHSTAEAAATAAGPSAGGAATPVGVAGEGRSSWLNARTASQGQQARDVLLGSGTVLLSKLLARPQVKLGLKDCFVGGCFVGGFKECFVGEG